MKLTDLYPKKTFNYSKEISPKEVLLINGKDGFAINQMGLDIWRMCNGKNSVKKIIETIHSDYSNVPYEEIQEDICELLISWHENDVVILDYNYLFKLGKKNKNISLNLDDCFICNKKQDNLDVLFLIPPPSTIETNLFSDVRYASSFATGYLYSIIEEKFNKSQGILNLWYKILTEEVLIEILKKFKPKVLAFSCMSENYSNAIRIAGYAKKNFGDDCFILMGGPHVTFEYENALNSDVIDLCFLGESFSTFPKFISSHFSKENWKNSNGLAYKNEGKIINTGMPPYQKELDNLPFPKHIDTQISHTDVIPIMSSMGCPFTCKFCAAAGLAGSQYRLRSISSVMDEIEYMLNKYGNKHVSFLDDTLTAIPERVTELCNEIKKRKLNFSWSAESRVDVVAKNPELLKNMHEVGCIQIQFGIESGDDKKLKEIRKGITSEMIFKALKNAEDAKIPVFGTMIIGVPGESVDSILSTLDFAIKLQKEYNGMFVTGWFVPYPGTYYYENIKKYDSVVLNLTDYDSFNSTIPSIIPKGINEYELQNLFWEKTFERTKNVFGEHKVESNLNFEIFKYKNKFNYRNGMVSYVNNINEDKLL